MTAADDDTLRLWGPAGQRLSTLQSKGGRVGALAVDESHELVLAAAADKAVYVYKLDEPAPLARWVCSLLACMHACKRADKGLA